MTCYLCFFFNFFFIVFFRSPSLGFRDLLVIFQLQISRALVLPFYRFLLMLFEMCEREGTPGCGDGGWDGVRCSYTSFFCVPSSRDHFFFFSSFPPSSFASWLFISSRVLTSDRSIPEKSLEYEGLFASKFAHTRSLKLRNWIFNVGVYWRSVSRLNIFANRLNDNDVKKHKIFIHIHLFFSLHFFVIWKENTKRQNAACESDCKNVGPSSS